MKYGFYDGTKYRGYTLDDWISLGLGFGVVAGMITAIVLRIYV